MKIHLSILICVIAAVSMLAQGYETGGPEQTRPAFQWPEGKEMALSLTFDDARLSQIDKGLPILERYGVKATFYVSPEWMVQRVDGWKEAVINNHDIGNHSLVHPCTGNFSWSQHKALEDYTLGQMSHELDSANHFIEEILGITPASFGYPCGQTFVGRGQQTSSYVPLVSAMFETGRTWLDEGPNDPVYCDLAQLTGMELDGKRFDQILDPAAHRGRCVADGGPQRCHAGEYPASSGVLGSVDDSSQGQGCRAEFTVGVEQQEDRLA